LPGFDPARQPGRKELQEVYSYGWENFIENGIKSHKAVMSSNFNRVRIDGRPHPHSGFPPPPALAALANNSTNRQWFLVIVDRHGMSIGQETVRPL